MLPTEPPAADPCQGAVCRRHGLLLVGVSPVVANLIASAFNILYNQTQIWPYLDEAQRQRFDDTWMWFNLLVYPVAVASWALPLVMLRRVHRALLLDQEVPAERLVAAQRRVVNLPWWILTVATVSWLSCTLVFPLALASMPGKLPTEVVWHLITSFVTASLIAVTHSFFAVELVSQWTLFPVFFREGNPADVPGGRPMSITARGIFWTLSAVVSPVVSLMLLLLIPNATQKLPLFGVAVGGVAIAFGLTSRLDARPTGGRADPPVEGCFDRGGRGEPRGPRRPDAGRRLRAAHRAVQRDDRRAPRAGKAARNFWPPRGTGGGPADHAAGGAGWSAPSSRSPRCSSTCETSPSTRLGIHPKRW